MTRIRALLAKEWLELRRHPGLLLPAVLVTAVVTALPVFVAVVVPALTGERLSESNDLEAALGGYRLAPAVAPLDPESAAQAYVFHYFLLLLVLAPITAAVSVAAHGIVGEKLARTLEPVLVTPISTVELLLAKTLAAFVPALALTAGGLAVYGAAVAACARPGVLQAFLQGPTTAFVLIDGPLAALAAIQTSVCVSSRAQDPRAAQQFGALLVLPVVGLFVAQLAGVATLDARAVASAAALLLGVNGALLALAVRLFDRETILVRWR